jgi:long-chain acyl-CoA synthetase
MKADNVEIVPGPYNHSNPLRRVYANLYNGSTAVLIDGVIFAARFFEAIEKHRVTAITLVPSFVTILFQLTGDKLGDYEGQIDYIQVGGSIFPQTEKARLRALLPSARLYDFYGCTEAGCACSLDFGSEPEKMTSIGRPSVNAIFKFVDDKGRDTEGTKEKPAFLAYGGTMLMREYFGDPQLTEKTVKNGYVVTRDLGYRDADGYFYIIGRQDDIINVGSIKIAPSEIEEAALTHPDVVAAACVGVDDAMFGQVPRLFVVAKKAGALDMAAFRKHLAKKVDDSKMPRPIVEIDDLPKNSNGKVSRQALKKL